MEGRDSQGRFVKGHKISEELKEINRKTQTGSKCSEETKKKHSVSSKEWHKKLDNKKRFSKAHKKEGMKRRKWKTSKEELYDLYWNQKLSIRQIAKKLNTSYGVVHSLFRRENIPRRISSEGRKLNPQKLTEKGRKILSKKVSKNKKDAWQDPKYREKMLVILEDARKNITEESIRKMKEKNSFTWLNDYKTEIIDLYKSGDSTEKIGKKFGVCGTSISKLLKKNGVKINPLGGITKIRKLEKEDEWLNQRNKKIGEGNEGIPPSEEAKIKQSISHKKLWEDEEFAKKMFKSLNIRPNKPEKVIIRFIEKFLLPFKYVGDGKIWIGGRCPDFISTNGDKKIIEMHGRAFHDPNSRRGQVVKIPYRRTEKGTIEHYTKHGYKTLVIWDDELKNPNQVINKITNFS